MTINQIFVETIATIYTQRKFSVNFSLQRLVRILLKIPDGELEDLCLNPSFKM